METLKKLLASYISGNGIFQPKLKKQKIYTQENVLHFRKWNFLTLKLRNLLYFLKIKLSLYFGK